MAGLIILCNKTYSKYNPNSQQKQKIMKLLSNCFLIFFLVLNTGYRDLVTLEKNDNEQCLNSLRERNCSTNFGGDVRTYSLSDGHDEIGVTIWISRKSGNSKAKYFAHKQGGNSVYERYTTWKKGKKVFLMSSGAYATGWDDDDEPVGLTVDNGIIVNRRYEEDMDGLVIVYATGGVAVSNIENGNLNLKSLGKTVDVKDVNERAEFLKWAADEDATVFQTHLLVYKNEMMVDERTSSTKKSTRKFLVSARDSAGDLFHIIFYLKHWSCTLFESTKAVNDYLQQQRMNVISIINLDTGGFDILKTNGDVKDCSGQFIVGRKNNTKDMTNLLAYEYQ